MDTVLLVHHIIDKKYVNGVWFKQGGIKIFWAELNSDECTMMSLHGNAFRLTGASLQWRHNGCDGVSNHQPHDCLLNRLFRRISKKTSKLHVTGLCEGNSPVTGEFPSQRVSNAENVSIWWRHHVVSYWPFVWGVASGSSQWANIADFLFSLSMMTSSNGKHFPRYWPFVRGIRRSPVNSPHKGQWRGTQMFFYDLRLIKRLSKQSWGWWFETPSLPLWRHCNG